MKTAFTQILSPKKSKSFTHSGTHTQKKIPMKGYVTISPINPPVGPPPRPPSKPSPPKNFGFGVPKGVSERD